MRAILLTLAFAAMPALSHGASLCQKGETDYFSCKIQDSAKSVSLCGSELHTFGGIGRADWLQYRYGVPGRLELVYPQSKQPLLQHFTGEFAGTESSTVYGLQFKPGPVDYAIIAGPDNHFIANKGRGDPGHMNCDEAQLAASRAKFDRFAQLVKELSKRVVPK
ncbi:hypothetical protein [Massilia sp. CF038]|uniref:hypothetical protein n=1 Tax=Massilia sp. CF038 TaxID=1881045 RepID=UPI00091934CD|nr:hypothetical protein [Massilia sp. CF038]SHH27119.1 hypothetical protein SAMN05428948_3610 [Massilia sp. CF038]